MFLKTLHLIQRVKNQPAKLNHFRYFSSLKFKNFENGPQLKDFLANSNKNLNLKTEAIPYLAYEDLLGYKRKVFFEIYGCQMNVNDTEIVWSIMKNYDYLKTEEVKEADVVLIITCSIREGAETKIWNRLKHLTAMKKNRSKQKPLQIGILGCMAERLKNTLLEKERCVDLVAGPDSYKDLPRLLATGKNGRSAVNVLLSLDETYADIVPVKLDENSKTAFVSIMRGCDNMCTYCIVPFTRGRERSRPLASIKEEIKSLANQGIKEITLLGQNVNSYRDISTKNEVAQTAVIVPGFKTVYKTKVGGLRFFELLQEVAQTVPEVRIRFTSPHPKDFPTQVLETIKAYPNICKSIHLPAQTGSSSVLDRMRRGYTRESYVNLVSEIRTILPEVTLSSDFICGFCGETDEEFEETISLIQSIKYNIAYLFAYSMREKTTAHRRYEDNVPNEIKLKRLNSMIQTFRNVATELQTKFIGKRELVLIEGTSKRSSSDLYGRNDGNLKVIIPANQIPRERGSDVLKPILPGDYVAVDITYANSQILKGNPLCHASIEEYY